MNLKKEVKMDHLKEEFLTLKICLDQSAQEIFEREIERLFSFLPFLDAGELFSFFDRIIAFFGEKDQKKVIEIFAKLFI